MSDIFLVFWLTRRRLYEASRYGLERCPFYIATAALSCKSAATRCLSGRMAYSMIPKSGYRFSEKIMLK
jgi:hypothetical protein